MWFGVHTVQNTVFRNFSSKCAFRIKIQITHFAVVWKQSRMLFEYVHIILLRENVSYDNHLHFVQLKLDIAHFVHMI